MKTVLLAWCGTGAPYLDALTAAGAPPALVVTGRSTSAESALRAACAPRSVALLACADVNAPDVVERITALAPDLLLVAGCSQRLRAPLLAAPRLAALNFHPSLLPHYRGKEPLFWALLHGEPEVGVTVHRMTEAIDQGPLVLQRAVPVPARATSASLARDVDQAGAELVPELLAKARRGLDRGLVPGHAGSAFPPLRPHHGFIDWTRSALAIDRLVRAALGEMTASVFVRGVRALLLDAHPFPAAHDAAPGTLLGLDGDALVIAAGEGAVAARRFLFLHRVHRGDELALALDLTPGDAFDPPPRA